MTSRERPAEGRGPFQALANRLERARLGAGLDYPGLAGRIGNGPSGIAYRKWVSRIGNQTYREMIGVQPPSAAAWNEAREASEASFIINCVLELRARIGPPRAGEGERLRGWGAVRRGTVIGIRRRLEQRDAVYPGAVTAERGCPALAHPGTVEKILETCLESRDNELFRELEAIRGRRWEARAAKESGRKEYRVWEARTRGKQAPGPRMMPPNPAARGGRSRGAVGSKQGA